MFKSEWKAMLKKKTTIIVLIGIAIVPSIYSVVFLNSLWDVYGSMDQLPVVVVNEDVPTTLEGKDIQVGNDLVEKMKESGSLDFHFENAVDAKEHLDDGTYYMMITIPSDFSKNAISIVDEQPKQMVLSYTTSDGQSYIASKFSDSAVTKLKSELTSEISHMYASVLVEAFGTVEDGMKTASDGAVQLSDGMNTLSDGSKTLENNLQTLKDSTLTFANGNEEFQVGLSSYIDGTTQLVDGANQIANKLPGLTNGVDQMDSGAFSLAQGTQELKDKSNTLSNGVGQLQDGSQQVEDGIATLQSKAGTLQSGVNELSNGMNQLNSALQQVSVMSDETKNPQLQQLIDGASSISSGLESLQASSNTIDVSAFTELQTLTNDLITQEATLQQIDVDMQNILSSIPSSGDMAEADVQALKANLQALQTKQVQVHTSYSATITKLQTIDFNALTTQLNTLKASIDSLQTAYNTPEGVYAGFTSFLQQIKDTFKSDGAILSGSTKINGGLLGVKFQMPSLIRGVNDLHTGASLVNGGLTDMNTQMPALVAGTDTLNTGMGKLYTGIHSMKGQLPMLNDGLTQFTTGGNTLISNNNNKLLDADAQLVDGSSKMKEGAAQLYDGSEALSDGSEQLREGSSTLSTGLQEGYDKLQTQNLNDQTVDMMGEPVLVQHDHESLVENNGTGMAPYMLSISLFVGMLAMTLLYDALTPNSKVKSAKAWWLTKMSVIFGMGVAQAVISYALMVIINGFSPLQPALTLGVLILESLMFASIITFFNILLDKIGAFFMLVFLVLQLAGSAGTYPIELSGTFFNAIHPFLPMSYGIDALRQTISIGGSIQLDMLVCIGILIVFSMLTYAFFVYRHKHQKYGKLEISL